MIYEKLITLHSFICSDMDLRNVAPPEGSNCKEEK